MRAAGAVLLTAGVVYLGFFVDRMHSPALLIAFTVAFAGYAACVRGATDGWLRYGIGLGIMLRVVLLFAFPRLSDDVYRFVWDGNLIVAGQSPFAHPPSYYMDTGGGVAGNDRALYDRLNSQDYYSVYPPVAQATFALAALPRPASMATAAVLLKLPLLLAEVGSLLLFVALLRRWRLPPGRVLLYWLNPLILVEIMGNLHFEGVMLCFLLLGLWLLTRSRYAAAGAAVAASVASKLLPLMFLPFLLNRLWRRPFWYFFLALGGVVLALFSPLVVGSGLLDGLGGSLDLYFRKFEFNGSLYYLLRAYGYYELGWNQIARFGPLLARIALGGILIIALADRRTDWRSLPAVWLAAFVLYLLCATTVHPWYLTLPVALCCFTAWRYPLLWSYLIMLTYTSYATVPYRENLWLVGAEYGLVAAMLLWERNTLKKERSVLPYGPSL